jgi:hypothetical protein
MIPSLLANNRLFLFFCLSAVVSIFSDSLLAISVDALKTPMKDLKNAAFSRLYRFLMNSKVAPTFENFMTWHLRRV